MRIVTQGFPLEPNFCESIFDGSVSLNLFRPFLFLMIELQTDIRTVDISPDKVHHLLHCLLKMLNIDRTYVSDIASKLT